MPVEFLTDTQKERYGQFAGELSPVELARYFHLDDKDLALIDKRRGDHNRLGFALQLGTVRCLGTFLPNPIDLPSSSIDFVAGQLNVTKPDCLPRYLERKQTRHAHRLEIQREYAYYDFNDPPWCFRLSRLLYARAWTSTERPSLLFDVATHWLVANKVLLPGATTLERLVSQIRERSSLRLWRELAGLPNQEQKITLHELLSIENDSRVSALERFRQGPVQVSGPSFSKALDRYQELYKLGIHTLNISGIPPVRLKNLARHVAQISAYKIARMPENRRLASLVAFAHAFETIALDDALDVLDLLIADIAGEAKKLGKKNRLRTLKDLDRAAIALAEACAPLLDEKHTAADLRDEIFAQVPRIQIKRAIETINDLARPPDDQFHDEMVAQYGRLRQPLSRLLDGIDFKAAPAGIPVINALNFLRTAEGTKKQKLKGAPIGVVTKAWWRLVFDKDGQVNRQGYTLCVLDQLQDALRRRDVYVEASDRWGDPRTKLLQGMEWEAKRVQVCRALGHPTNSDEALIGLTQQLDAAYRQTADRLGKNDAVRVEHQNGKPTLTITNLDKLDEPQSLITLREQVTALLPRIDLTELLLEIHTHTGFADAFTHVSESNARVSDLPISLCAVLVAEACNIGLEPLIQLNVPTLTRHRLHWAQQNYFRAETLVAANTRLVDHQSTIPLARAWGGGEVASADGLRFVTAVKTINAGPNRKYFGSGRGITWYNFLSDQYAGFHGIVVPGTLRDSIFVLEGLLEQQTGLSPREIMTDTAGTSDMIFGLFWLLGYQFSPRLADAGEARFWRLDHDADYGALDEVAHSCVNPKKVTQHWDDMLRIAGSLKLGTVQASALLRSLLRNERPSSLAQAIIEVGRINKTIYLLNYVDDEDYRRRILTQLNRGEGRHAVARTICYGKRGEIRQRYREGQEDQLGALGLVTNAVVLWNTIYMEAALNRLRHQGVEIKEADVARLSPLLHKHINMLGHYSFTLAEFIRAGVLRPLNSSELEYESA
jgi:TnpA family transposase